MRHIEVVYQDDNHAFVDDYKLEDLIHQGIIKMFYRPSEKKWVVIGIDRIRSSRTDWYAGFERRRTGQYEDMIPIHLRRDNLIPF